MIKFCRPLEPSIVSKIIFELVTCQMTGGLHRLRWRDDSPLHHKWGTYLLRDAFQVWWVAASLACPVHVQGSWPETCALPKEGAESLSFPWTLQRVWCYQLSWDDDILWCVEWACSLFVYSVLLHHNSENDFSSLSKQVFVLFQFFLKYQSVFADFSWLTVL